MNQKYITFMLLLLLGSYPVQAQIGIGVASPNSAAILETSSSTKGVLPPRLTTAQRNTITSNPTNNPALVGMMIYNTDKKCLETYNGSLWYNHCGDQDTAGTITGITCGSPTNTGTLIAGAATYASDVTTTISYTGGNGGYYDVQKVDASSANGGVTGLTATLLPGNFVPGNGTLTYTITGTPSAAGVATFAFTVDVKNCTFTRTVDAAPSIVPATITLGQNGSYSIASIYDNNYLPYSIPTGSATATRPVNPVGDTTNEALIDIQGKLTTAPVAVTIPVTATGSGTLQAYSTTITIDATFTEDGNSRDVTLSWPSQTYTAATTAVSNASIVASGTLNAKKLDINAGLGSDYKGIVMGQFPYPYNSAGATTNFELRYTPGIPDKMFGLADNSGSSTTHMMLYLPIVAADGNIWLNNNLGAHYANINNGSFNPAKQATSATDYLAYGSLFQWGRKPDGHELISYSSATTGAAVNGTTAALNNAPVNALFITNTTNPYDWRTAQDTGTLWATAASANNPCPNGFRVPSDTELTTLVTASGITNSATAASSVMKFSVPGYRNYSNGSLNNVGSQANYWSSSVSGIQASFRGIVSGGTYTNNDVRTSGYTVRCLKNNTSIGTITAINCAAPTTNSGTLVSGVVASGVSSVIAYTGGNGGTYAPQAIDSSTGGVTGLTANLSGGNFASGAGTLNFSITGTPSSNGTATFTFIVGGQSCSFTRTVDATITLGQSVSYSIASIYDQDYLPYTTPTVAATKATQAADGVNEAVTINLQGTLTTASVAVTIPVTATGSGTLPAYSKTITIAAINTEDGISRDVTLSWPSQTYTTATTAVSSASIVASATLNAKKLDINAGLGSDYQGVLMGLIPYPYNRAGTTTNFELRVTPGIPDKMFGLADNDKAVSHNFLYLPVTAPNGSIWLSHNLGADYTNINSSRFNIGQQATSATDYVAYGSLFQWGRKPDGHELIYYYLSSTIGYPVNTITTTTIATTTSPTHANFIINNAGTGDWYNSRSDDLWATVNSANNPCPNGFRVPTIAELGSLNFTNSSTAYSSVLKFTVSGGRSTTGSLVNMGIDGKYWSSSVSNANAMHIEFTSGGTETTNDYRATARSVRCIKN